MITMRIVMANNYYYLRGGSERVLFEEKRLLEENGHKVVVFSRAHPKNEYSEYADYFTPFVDWQNLSLLKKVPAAINIIYNQQTGKSFLKFLEEFKPDMIHAHIIYGGLTTSILDAAQRKHIPVVMTLHDYKLICPSYLMLNRGNICEDCMGGKFMYCLFNRCHKESFTASLIYCIESYLNKWLRKYDKIHYLICPSLFSLKKHAENGIPEERMVYIPNFINYVNYEPNYEKGDYILFVGRLSKEKGVLTLLKAVKKLGVHLKIVGDGPMMPEYEAFVEENGMSHVTFEGYKLGEELRKLYQGAAFLVTASECYENAPMMILEAFAYGKPVIGPRIGGFLEMIEPSRTGVLFTIGNTNELRECIQELWAKRSLVSEMGRTARRKVELEFSSEVHYRNLIHVYRQATNKNEHQ